MLNIQKKYLEYLEKIKEELNEVGISIESIETLNDALLNTELLVPVVGAFSAGKSALINSFLGNQYLSVGITPETALATELRYSNKEFIEAVKADNSIVEYAISEMNEIKNRAGEYKFIRLYLNNNKLKTITPFVLVDMPGFDSPLDLHNQAIVSYINKGVHYVILTSVEDGNITRSMIRQLSDIQEFGRDFSFFLSKANLKADSEVKEIAEKIEEQLDEHFDISKKIISIDNDGGNSLEKVIKEIAPEELFKKLFITELKNNYFTIADTINVSISALKKDKKENEHAIVELKKGIEKLIQKRDWMLEEAKKKYSDVNVNRIIDSVGRELSESLNELVASALHGGQESLSQHITEIVRHSLIAKVKTTMVEVSDSIVDDFALELKDIDAVMSSFSMSDNWLEKVTESTKNMFNKTNSALQNMVNNRSKKGDADKIYKVITTVLAITTTVLTPILEVVIIFLPEILSKVFESIQKKKQEEQIKNHILGTVIPSIKRELREKLPVIFQEQVNNLIKEISSEFEGLLQDKQKAIVAMEEKKQDKINDIEQEISKYNTIKNNITTLANNTLFIKEI